MSLKRYFIIFFLICLMLTCICGVLAALMPAGVGGILTAVPYLVAMIWVLFRFLKRNQRAPTQAERKRLTMGYTLIFWGYNVAFQIIGVAIFAMQDPEIWQNFLLYLQQAQFLSIVLIMALLLAIPLYVLTYWFYGPQAKRMSVKMFGHE
ncbi:ABZJ_00895 family protein [Acinetobacter johnsonii]|nr:ABZJ_00895 family protein [Acinetobacter johnsonii]